MTAQYLEVLDSLASGSEYEIYITNVPAPMKLTQASETANLERANLIKVYNDFLAKKLKNSSFKLLDLYNPTLGSNGMSNSLFHVDQIHLSRAFLNTQVNKLLG